MGHALLEVAQRRAPQHRINRSIDGLRCRRLNDAKRQHRADEIEADDYHVGRSHADGCEQAGAAQRAGDARGVGRGSRDADGADQLIRRHDVGDQRAPHAEIGRPHQTHDRDADQHIGWGQIAGQRQHCHGDRQERIARAHHGQQVTVTDAVADHAEYRGDQGTGVIERAEQGQQQHRSSLDQHIPAEDQRLHLERPRCEQIGRPLESIIPDAEGCQRGRPREPAQNSMPRFIAFHPVLFLVGTRFTASRQPRPAPDISRRSFSKGHFRENRFQESRPIGAGRRLIGGLPCRVGKPGVNQRRPRTHQQALKNLIFLRNRTAEAARDGLP